MRTVIFDLDGTLADTSGDLLAAANACFVEMGAGRPLERGRDDAVALKGGSAMLRLGFERLGRTPDQAELDRWYPVLLEAYGDAICNETIFFPGALDAIEVLRGRGVAVGIATNKPEGLAHQLLAALGAGDVFGSMIGADTLSVKKPDPAHFWAAVDGAGGDRARALMVGDTETDRDTARAAGVPCILVGFGPAAERVAAMNHDHVLDHYDGLAGMTDRLLGA